MDQANKESYRLINERNGEVIAEHLLIAKTLRERMVGLLGRNSLPAGEGLLIRDCSMVHMWFMRFAIDVVFCGADDCVRAVSKNLRPWWISRKVWGGSYVVELPAGTLANLELKKGDKLLIR